MHDRLWSWRQGEAEASFEEVMEKIGQESKGMMRPLA